MTSLPNCIGITNPSADTAILLVLTGAVLLLVWPLWADLFPDALISRPWLRLLDFVQTGRPMRALSSMAQRLAPLGHWVIDVLVRIFFHRKGADHL